MRSLEQFIQTVKGQNNFDNRMLFKLVPGGFSYLTNQNSYWKKLFGFRNMQETFEKVCSVTVHTCEKASLVFVICKFITQKLLSLLANKIIHQSAGRKSSQHSFWTKFDNFSHSLQVRGSIICNIVNMFIKFSTIDFLSVKSNDFSLFFHYDKK